MMLYLLTAIG